MPETKQNAADKPQHKQPGQSTPQPGQKPGQQKQPSKPGQPQKDTRR